MKPDLLDAWHECRQRCKAQGLALTASRDAILYALLEQSEACDAVPLLMSAQKHHASTSIGTVYRFMRELERRGLVDAYAQAHGRTRWQLRGADAQAANDIRRLWAQVQDFLHASEHAGVADTTLSKGYAKELSLNRDRMLAILHEVAGHLGYRLFRDPRYPT